MYISLFLGQHNYIFSYVCYNTTCFGPLCGPSSGVSGGGHTISWRNVRGVCWVGGDLVMWVLLLCNASRNIGISPPNVTVAQGVSCFYLFDENCIF